MCQEVVSWLTGGRIKLAECSGAPGARLTQVSVELDLAVLSTGGRVGASLGRGPWAAGGAVVVAVGVRWRSIRLRVWGLTYRDFSAARVSPDRRSVNV